MQNNIWKKTMKYDFLDVLDAKIILIFSLACGCISCIVGFMLTAENDGWIAAIFLIAIIFLIVFIFTILEGIATRIKIIEREELKKVETEEKAEEAVPGTEGYDITPAGDGEVKIKKKEEKAPTEEEAAETKEEPMKSEEKAEKKEKPTKKSKPTAKKSTSTKKDEKKKSVSKRKSTSKKTAI